MTIRFVSCSPLVAADYPFSNQSTTTHIIDFPTWMRACWMYKIYDNGKQSILFLSEVECFILYPRVFRSITDQKEDAALYFRYKLLFLYTPNNIKSVLFFTVVIEELI